MALRKNSARSKADPVVDVEVGDKVVGDDLGEPSVVRPRSEHGEEKCDPDVGHDDLHAVSLLKDDRRRLEVVRPLRVVLLARRVPDQVRGLQDKQTTQSSQRDLPVAQRVRKVN